MDTYVILRRSAWDSPAELEQAAARSKQVGDGEMSDDIRWIREHASRADLAADEVIPVADTVLIRPDPEPAKT